MNRSAIERDIEAIKIELLRLASLPYASVYHRDRVVTLAQQQDYLEDYLAKLETEQKKIS